ncbi:MAG: amidohydrolase/deacetylase family metallohydrolase, partial [Chloroflexota bacterium]|nr:amidohydrolase/deacetylase family metallohydrolase [Chloroflexota bacterium]
PSGQAKNVVDASGLVVTPGLVDLHVHVFWGVSHFGIEPDPTCLSRGVTTAVDAGSAGATNFAGFRKYVIERSKTRLRAFLHISAQGLPYREIGELEDLRWADVPFAVEVARQHADVVLGIKVRLSQAQCGQNDLPALDRALDAATQLGKPVMVHVGDTYSPLEKILDRLRAGDVLTHAFTGRPHGVLDEKGRVIPAALEARKRGVVFDVGHGAGSFSFDVADKALSQGFGPTTISSDLHHYSLPGPVYDLATTLSKYMRLGLSLDEAVRLATAAPAKVMGMEGRIGTLRVGAEGDVALFRLEEGHFTFTDSYGKTADGRQRLVPMVTIRHGKVHKA